MDPNIEPSEELKDIQRLIGRNILLFQNIENILKQINHFKSGENSFQNLEKRKLQIEQLSFGRLTDNEVLKKIDSKLKYDKSKDIVFTYDFLPDDQSLNDSIAFLNSKNEDRNMMVHNFTDKWKLNIESDRLEAKLWLLNLYNETMHHRNVIAEILNKIQGRYEEWFEFVNSPDFDKFLGKY